MNDIKYAIGRMNIAEFASSVADRMSLNSKKTSVEEYETVYIKDEVLFNMIEDLAKYSSIQEEIMKSISSSKDKEEIKVLEGHLDRVNDYIGTLKVDIDNRRTIENIKREEYVNNGDYKKKVDTKFLIALGLVGGGALALCTKDGRKIILNQGGKVLNVASKNVLK